jgi:hypothetical protein
MRRIEIPEYLRQVRSWRDACPVIIADGIRPGQLCAQPVYPFTVAVSGPEHVRLLASQDAWGPLAKPIRLRGESTTYCPKGAQFSPYAGDRRQTGLWEFPHSRLVSPPTTRAATSL